MMKFLIFCFLTMIFSGCVSAKPPQVEFGSFLSEPLPAKSSTTNLLITTKDIEQKYQEIGIITVLAKSKETTYDELLQQMKQKALEVGADAVIKVEYGSMNKSVMVPTQTGFGSLGTTVQRLTCKGVAVAFASKDRVQA